MTDAKTELFDLKIIEGSFVDKGDNPEAHIAFFKRAEEEEKSYHGMEEEKDSDYGTPKTLMDFMHDEKMKDLKQSMMQSVHEVLCYADPSEWSSMLSQSVEQMKNVLDEMGHTVSKDENDSVVVDGATEEDVSNKKTQVGFDDVIADLTDEQKAVIEAKIAETAKSYEEAVAEKAAAEQDVAKRLESLEKRAEAAEAQVAKMQDEKLTAEFVKRASEIGCGDTQKMALLLKGAYSRSQEEGAELESQFRAMAEQAKIGQSNLFKSVGSSATGIEDASPDQVIESATKRIMESAPGMNYRDAYKQALSQNREVYSQMINTRGIAE